MKMSLLRNILNMQRSLPKGSCRERGICKNNELAQAYKKYSELKIEKF